MSSLSGTACRARILIREQDTVVACSVPGMACEIARSMPVDTYGRCACRVVKLPSKYDTHASDAGLALWGSHVIKSCGLARNTLPALDDV